MNALDPSLVNALSSPSVPAKAEDAPAATATAQEQRLAHIFRRQNSRPAPSPLQRAIYRYRGVPL